MSSDRRDGLGLVAAMVALMWVSESVDWLDSHRLDQYGIRPRTEDGLAGIVAAPFLHVSFAHLIGNTIPFAVMGAAVALGGLARVASVTVVVAAVSGIGTWLIAPAGTVHLGASGVVFGYATYLVAKAILARDLGSLAIGVVVGVLWGTALLGGLEPHDGISWQAHLFGAIGGVLAAWLTARRADGAAPRPSRTVPA